LTKSEHGLSLPKQDEKKVLNHLQKTVQKIGG